MKRFSILITLLSLIFINVTFSQVVFKGIPTDFSEKVDIPEIPEYELYEFDISALNKYVRTTGQDLSIEIELGDIRFPATLNLHPIRKPGLVSYIFTENGVEVAPSREEILFKGSSPIANDGEFVFAIDTEFFAGALPFKGKYYIIEPFWHHDPSAAKNLLIVYESTIVQFLAEHKCGTVDHANPYNRQRKFFDVEEDEEIEHNRSNPCREVQYGSALDWSFVTKYGGNNGAWNRVDFVMGLVETQYTGHFNWNLIYVRSAEYASACSTCDPWSTSNDAGVVLGSFRNWGNTGGFQGQTYDVAGLWTNRNFSGGTVGIAYINGMCNNNRYHALQDFSSAGWAMRVMVSHEIGHNLNYGHDTGTGFIMSPSVNNTTTWSQPSINTINTRLGNNSSNCLGDCTDPCENFTANVIPQATSCGFDNGTITVNITGGQQPYLVNIGYGFVQQTTFSNLEPGQYTVSIIDNNDCELEYVVVVQSSVRPVFSVLTGNTICGEDNGIIEINVTEGNPPYFYDIGLGLSPNPIFLNVAPGTYTITVTDALGCFDTSTATILPSDPLIAEIEIQNTSCGEDNGKITVTAWGGTMPYSYTISGFYQSSPIFDSLAAGFYNVEIIDVNNCFFVIPATINGSSGVVATGTSTSANCGAADGTITIQVTQGFAPFTYSLNGNSQSSNIFTGLTPGTYSIIVTDVVECTKTVQVTVGNVNNLNLGAVTTNANCGINQGSITVNVLNGTAPFQYDFGDGFQSNNSISGLAPGVYEVVARDTLGCEGQIEVEIFSSPNPNIEVSTTTSLCGQSTGSILITGSNGTGTFTYSIGGPFSNDPLFENLSAGVYLASVSDSLGCIAQSVVFVNSESDISATTIVNNAFCAEENGSAAVTAIGGQSPYTYDIGAGPQSNGLFENLGEGVYTVLITDADNCLAFATFEIESFGTISASVSTEPTTCGLPNGTVIVIASGGFGDFTYDIGQGPQNHPLFANLASGNYSVSITDEGGCTEVVSFTIQSSSSVEAEYLVTNTTCESVSGSITVMATGGTAPYTYNIGQGPQSGNKFDGLSAGTYTITTTDSEGCNKVRNVMVRNTGVLPIASFRSIINGTNVIFINTSTGNPNASLWDFGDGNTSTSFNATHTYSALNSYTVCLTVYNDCGNNTVCELLTIDGERDCNALDSIALVALYEATNGPDWINTWTLGNPTNTWFGLTFDPQGCLLRIDLSDNNLSGTLPSEIGDFLTLKGLDLSNNDLDGTLIPQLGNLAALESLNLSGNLFEGSVPVEVSTLFSINSLDLSFNDLDGELPNELYTLISLTNLDLSSNKFSGQLNDEIGNLERLVVLNLSNNGFVGSVPDVWNNTNKLRKIYLQKNNFSGEVPESIVDLDSLQALWLSENRFSGLGVLLSDNWVDLPDNGLMIEGNQFTFKDILPNKYIIDALVNRAYSPQARVYKDTMISMATGMSFNLDIEVDNGIPGTEYRWIQNGTLKTVTNVPLLEVNNLTTTDAGTYFCEITHPDAPELTLVSYNITVEVGGTSTGALEDSYQWLVAPNPVKAGTELIIREINNIEGISGLEFSIINLEGKVPATTGRTYISGENSWSVKAPSIPGTYVLTINDNQNMVYRTTIIVQ